MSTPDKAALACAADVEFPASPRAEQGALGCVLLDGQLAHDLRPGWFHDVRHQVLCGLLAEMGANGQAISAHTVFERLEARGELEMAGGLSYLAGLPDATASAGLFGQWAAILDGKAALRQAVKVGLDLVSAAQERDADAEAVIAEAERSVFAIRESAKAGSGNEVDLGQELSGVVADMEAAFLNQGALRGLATGFHDLDRLTGGLRPGQLVILAARPGIGKTSLAMNIAERGTVDDGVPVGVFSLEMTARELLHRMACCRARVDSASAQRGSLTERDIARLTKAIGQVGKAPLHICERGGLTVEQLAGLARRMALQHGIKLLIIDYLQLLRSADKRQSRYESITEISAALKTLAKDIGVPVLCLSQLNRNSESEARQPRLSDLRDSGSIEQDADIVGLLHREQDAQGDAYAVSLNIAKHRNGAVDKIGLTFLRKFTRFE